MPEGHPRGEAYLQRHRICEEHLKGSLMKDDKMQLFCNQ